MSIHILNVNHQYRSKYQLLLSFLGISKSPFRVRTPCKYRSECSNNHRNSATRLFTAIYIVCGLRIIEFICDSNLFAYPLTTVILSSLLQNNFLKDKKTCVTSKRCLKNAKLNYLVLFLPPFLFSDCLTSGIYLETSFFN